MSNNRNSNCFRMGVLVDFLDEHLLGPRLNWDSSVVGVFFGPNPPLVSVVQYIVDSQWVKRDRIVV